jgi:hypothetical protein
VGYWLWVRGMGVCVGVGVDCGLWVMGYGLWAMDYGLWVVGYGSWVVGCGLWVVGYGLWAMDYGLLVMGYGSWVMGRGLWVVDNGYGVWAWATGYGALAWGTDMGWASITASIRVTFRFVGYQVPAASMPLSLFGCDESLMACCLMSLAISHSCGDPLPEQQLVFASPNGVAETLAKRGGCGNHAPIYQSSRVP